MNTRSILWNQLKASPFDDALFGALVDCVAEEENRDPARARALVAHLVEPHRDALHMAEAAKLLHPDARTRLIVHGYLRWLCHLSNAAPLSIILVAGHDVKWHTERTRSASQRFWPLTTVTIGAREVIRVCQLHKPTDRKFYVSRIGRPKHFA